MLTLAENVIIEGADNRPPMLDKTQYIWNSYTRGTSTTPAIVRHRRYDELSEDEKICESCDIKATNIFLQGLPQDIYNLVNHHDEAKAIWDIGKLLIQGSEISLQERESKLYDEFDMFTSDPGEPIHLYYMRFTQMMNDMHIIGMTMKPIQFNTKFINHLQPEWSKFVTDVKLAKDMYNANFDHLFAYMWQHKAHANEALIHTSSYQAHVIHQRPQASFPQMDSGLDVLLFLPTDDPISSLNKAMTFISTTFTSKYLPTNNQLRTLSNPRNQVTIQDGRVTVQTVQGRQTQAQEYACSGVKSTTTGIGINKSRGNYLSRSGKD
uniref:Integrase, catalytic region, zinc finger, CCHC-type, peptidase aspartic, catalytic n=1 Tax=Tanacetum cinerariifolium TaxID=118510 RepID=A0A699HC56_TANCI|nr:hypothetical protein [Tanacetum cinerariifolium]